MEEWKKNPITWVIIIVNVAVFVAVEFTGGSENTQNMIRWGAQYYPMVEQGQYYRLFTCMFLHFGLVHLGNNMLIFYFVGGYLERAVGKIRFFLIYMLGGLGASSLSFCTDLRHKEAAVSAGASGAIFAVIGALIWVLMVNRGRLENLTVRQMGFLAILSLYFGFTSTGVDNTAHVGGFLCGFLLAILLYRRGRRNIQVVEQINL